MKYLLLIRPDKSYTGPVPPEVADATEAWVKEMEDRGIRLIGDRIRPAEDGTGVRVRGGKVVTTDGPFAESKEQMGGFDVIECRDLDEAIEVASKHPVAGFGMVEIRPFWVE
ncbi:MAG TPA: YciI family protein [Kribbella sp.]|nr:YciI family protein [Kribbella sp.]